MGAMATLRFDRDGDMEDAGEIMAYRKDDPPSIGSVTSCAQESRGYGRANSLTIELPDGSERTGPGSHFRTATKEECEKYMESLSD
jgi:hypothetical protein